MKPLLLPLLLVMASAARAEEGMWTLDNLPLAELKQNYDFEPTADWIEHVQLGSVRFNDGGSGSFVSPDGLVLTNHHVALGQLQKVSTEKKDYVREGFFARKPSEELPCPDLELNQLVSMENVTARVLKAVSADASEKERNEQRKAEMARVEKESTDTTGLRSDVIELYRGGEYWLYRYKKYTDIRLVMAPEMQAAFYGGDPDNFTYPRFDVDMAFFRVYEDGKPVHPQRWFKLNPRGAKENELVFVSGHPGSTDRLKTVAQLEFERDHELPTRLAMYALRRKAYQAYSARGAEQARRAKDRLFGIENALKAKTGEYEGLKDPALFDRKEREEKALRAAGDPSPWEKIAAAQKEKASRHKEYTYRRLSGSRLASYAETIVRYVAEVKKPNEKRYEEFRDSALESLKFKLFSPAPNYADLEQEMLAVGLKESRDMLGAEDEFVTLALDDKEPAARAAALIGGTKLFDVEFRKKLIEGGAAAVQASEDPLIVLARKLDPGYRELRKWYEDGIQSVEAIQGQKIAEQRFALYGKSAYPDATFTLRLSYGKAAGYEHGTTRVPYKTTFYGLYDRAAGFDNRAPFDLAPLEAERRKSVDLSTPLDFVTTNDIIGGNSGSPVLNRDAELVGLIFDGNIQSLVIRYAYTETEGRAVAVHSAAIMEALRSIYRMESLADELVPPHAG